MSGTDGAIIAGFSKAAAFAEACGMCYTEIEGSLMDIPTQEALLLFADKLRTEAQKWADKADVKMAQIRDSRAPATNGSDRPLRTG